MGQHILAIEFAGDRVRAAFADRNFKTLELISVHQEARAADEVDVSGALERVLAATGRPDIVITALPAEFVAKRLLKLPFADRRRLQQVVPFALEEHLPFAVDESAVAFARVGKEEQDTLVLAAIARRAELQSHLEILERAALDPKIVTLSTFALAGYLARTRNGAGGAHLIVELDDASVSMVLLDAGGAPRALRTVARRHSADNGRLLEESTLGALRQVLMAHATQGETPEVVLAAGAAQAGLQEELATALATPVRDLMDFDGGALIHGINGHGGGFAGCFAMLAGEAPVAPLELLNFRQGLFAFHGATGAAHPLRLTSYLAGAAVLAAALHMCMGMAVNARQLRFLDAQIAAIAEPVLGPSTDPATAHATLKNRIADLSKQLRSLGGNLGQGSPLDLLRDMSLAIPPSIPLQVNNLQIDDSGIKLDGSADSFATVDQIKRALERSRDFSAIEVEHAGAGSDTSKVEFRLSATPKDVGS